MVVSKNNAEGTREYMPIYAPKSFYKACEENSSVIEYLEDDPEALVGAKTKFIKSSPELKFKLAFLKVSMSVCSSVNFSQFCLFHRNNWGNINHTYHKASVCKGYSSLFK